MRDPHRTQRLITEAVEDSWNGSLPLPDLLRKMLAVGSRVGSDNLRSWARQELLGYRYGEGREIPHYRHDLPSPAEATFIDTEGGQYIRNLEPRDLPDHQETQDDLYYVDLMLSASALQTIVDSRSSYRSTADDALLALLQAWAEEGKVDSELKRVVEVERPIATSDIIDVCDAIRTTALELCLAIEEELPLVEELQSSGDSSASTPVEITTIDNRVTQIITGTEISHISQSSQPVTHVGQGDWPALMAALTALGLDEGAQAELSESIERDDEPLGERTTSFLEKVKNGGLSLGAGVTRETAVSSLTTALNGFLGIA